MALSALRSSSMLAQTIRATSTLARQSHNPTPSKQPDTAIVHLPHKTENHTRTDHQSLNDTQPPASFFQLAKNTRTAVEENPASHALFNIRMVKPVFVLRDTLQATDLLKEARMNVITDALKQPDATPVEVGIVGPCNAPYEQMGYMPTLIPRILALAPTTPELKNHEIRMLVMPTEKSFKQATEYAKSLIEAGFSVRLTFPMIVPGDEHYAKANLKEGKASEANTKFLELATTHLAPFFESLSQGQKENFGVGAYISGAPFGTETAAKDCSEAALSLQKKILATFSKFSKSIGIYPSSTYGAADYAVWASYLTKSLDLHCPVPVTYEPHLHRNPKLSKRENEEQFTTLIDITNQLLPAPVSFHVSPLPIGGSLAFPGVKAHPNLDLTQLVMTHQASTGRYDEATLLKAHALSTQMATRLGMHHPEPPESDPILSGLATANHYVTAHLQTFPTAAS